ncbi:MAG TPA: thiol reductase thioredoxin [Thermoanaerobaculia bacterium]|nr:thiol reductase thioredoxin [Thermoanaerobaculia bacterium]
MRAYVFTDKSLERYAGRFVWLSIDTENATNAAFLKAHPISVWPTLLILDPNDKVVFRYAGGGTVPQIRKLLDDGERAAQGSHGKADTLLIRADALASQGKQAEAAKVFEEAIAAAPKNWPRLGRASESLVFALLQSQNSQACAERALALYPRVRGTGSAVNVAGTGLSCATDLDPKKSWNRSELVAGLEKATAETLAAADKIAMSADDRSGLYESLADARDEAKDAAAAHALREQWAAFLEKEVAKAKTADQRAVYDSHRLTAYLGLKQPEKAIAMLERDERDLPNDYNPPARLISAYKAAGRFDDALAASDRALKLAYGPRKIGIYRNRASVYMAKGDKESAKKTIEEAIRFAESLPTEQQSANMIASMKKQLTTM